MALAQESIREYPTESTTFVLDELCTPPAVATLLGVSSPTVYSAIRREIGGLSHIRTPGGQIRVRRRDVLAYCHRVGIEVPYALFPPQPEVVVIHPDPLRGNRLRAALKGKYSVQLHRDTITGLMAVGRAHPPVVVVSRAIGDEAISRLVSATGEESTFGYVTLIVLETTTPTPRWTGGSFELPLSLSEQGSRAPAEISRVVERLLGTP